MTRKVKRPAIVVVEPVRARAVRGPRPGGVWYWRAEVYQGGKGTGRTIATFWAHRGEVGAILVAQIADHGLDQPEAPSEIETVRDLMETWAAAQQERAGVSDTWKRSARHSGSRLCAQLGAVRLDRLGDDDVDGYRDRMLRTEANPKGIASATVKQDFKMLAAAWRWGRKRGFTPNRDLPRSRVEVVATRPKRTPTRDEIIRVIAAMDEGWPRLAVRLLFATGARPSEVARLTWGQVDLERGELLFTKTKTKKDRTVPLHPQVVEEIRAWLPRDREPEPTEGIFGVTWKMVRSKLGTRDIDRACAAAKVTRFTPYGLRRAAVDAMRRAGVDAKTAATITGHSEVVMLQTYSEASDEDRRSAIARTQLGAIEEADVIEGPWTAEEGE
jgi:integrase